MRVGGCVRVHVEGRQVVSWAVRGWRGQKHTRGSVGRRVKMRCGGKITEDNLVDGLRKEAKEKEKKEE